MASYYDIIITKILRPDAKRILARHLARDPGVHLSDALAMLERLPLIYQKEVLEKEVGEITAMLRGLGVETKALLRRRSETEVSPGGSSAPPAVSPASSAVPAEHRSALDPPPRHAPEPVLKTRVTFSETDASAAAHPRKKANARPLIGILTVLFIVAAIIAMLVLSARNPANLRTPALSLADMQAGAENAAPGAAKAEKGPKLPPRAAAKKPPRPATRPPAPASANQKVQSDSYVDSARAAAGSAAERYYKLALSFNEGNPKAWNGLIAAYRSMGDTAAADSIIAEMIDRLGSAVSDVGEIVKPYGDLVDFSTDSSGVCRLEYLTRVRLRDELEPETYEIVKALASAGDCSEVSLYAVTGKGSGMLVRIKTALIPPVFQEYARVAIINWLE